MTTPGRPPLRWHGGKWRLAPWILSHFPPHAVYVEPFGGGASVLLRKPPIAAECYNDLDEAVVNVFRCLRDNAAATELQRRLRLTPFARAEFDDAYLPAADEIDFARKTIMLSFMGFGSDSASRGCRTGFRSRLTDARTLSSANWATYADAIPTFSLRLMHTCIERADAFDLVPRYDTDRTLFYLDPPYVHDTRSSFIGRSSKTHGYRYEMSDAEHVALLDLAADLKGMAIISGYPSRLYAERLANWRMVTRRALADGARKRTEAIWLSPRVAQFCGGFNFGEGNAGCDPFVGPTETNDDPEM